MHAGPLDFAAHSTEKSLFYDTVLILTKLVIVQHVLKLRLCDLYGSYSNDSGIHTLKT